MISAGEFLSGKLSPEGAIYYLEDFYYNAGFPMPSLEKAQRAQLVDTLGKMPRMARFAPAPLLDLPDRQALVANSFEGVDFWDSIEGGKESYETYQDHLLEEALQDHPLSFIGAMQLNLKEGEKNLLIPDENDTYGLLLRQPDGFVDDVAFGSRFGLRYGLPDGRQVSRQKYTEALLESGQAIQSDEDGRVWVYPVVNPPYMGSYFGEHSSAKPTLLTPESLIARLIHKTFAKHEVRNDEVHYHEPQRWGPAFTGFEAVNENICEVEAADDDVTSQEIVRKVGGAIAGADDLGASQLKGMVRPPAIYLRALPLSSQGLKMRMAVNALD